MHSATSRGTAIPIGARERVARRAWVRRWANRASDSFARTAATRSCRRSCSPTAERAGARRSSSRRTRCTRTSRRSRTPRSSPASAGADFTVDADAAIALVRSTRPSLVFLCSPNNPTGTVEPRETVERLLAVVAEVGALLVVDEAYGEFAPWSALELVDDDQPLVVVRTYSKVWSLAAVRLGFAVAPSWVIDELEKVLLPYALSVPTQLAGTIALDFHTEMEHRGRRAGRGARAPLRRARRAARPVGGAVGCELPARAGQRRRPRSLAPPARARRARSRLLEPTRCRRVFPHHGRQPGGERRVPGRDQRGTTGGGQVSEPSSTGGGRYAEQKRTTKETTVDLELEVDGSGTTTVSTGIPFFDHMLEQLGKHAGFDLRIEATWRSRGRPAPHRRRRRHRARQRAARGAGRQARRAPLRQRARAARRGARAGGARSLGPAVPRVRRGAGRRVDRHLRSAARRGILEGIRRRRARHVAHSQPDGQERPPRDRGVVQGRGARCAMR